MKALFFLSIGILAVLVQGLCAHPDAVTVCKNIAWNSAGLDPEWKEFKIARSGIAGFLNHFPNYIACEGPCPCPARLPTVCHLVYNMVDGKDVFTMITNSTDVQAYRWHASDRPRTYLTFSSNLTRPVTEVEVFTMSATVVEKYGPDCTADLTIDRTNDLCPTDPNKVSPGLCGCGFDDSLIGHPCGTGHLGVCAVGVIHCSGGHQYCVQTTAASSEVCNGLDDDCDGQVDEEIAPAACGTDVGECSAGTAVCTNGSLVCQNAVGPVAETCNGLDDDCDGTVDNIAPDVCGANVGECSAGTMQCVNGAPTCVVVVGPTDEVCDGLDNDCNGLIDDNITSVTCGSDVGECQSGMTECVNGNLACTGRVGPVEESCNGLDDDCDGLVDNGVVFDPSACGSDVGECSAGTLGCSGGSPVCIGSVLPLEEVCDGLDNDCNGLTDDGIQSVACGSDVGECQSGMSACQNGTTVCVGRVDPTGEVCDGLDNDCNGLVDDGVPNCVNGTNVTCTPTAETCNGLDDDCDGLVDEDFANKGQACQTTLGSCTNAGVYVCTLDGTGTECSAAPVQDSGTCADRGLNCGTTVTNCGIHETCGGPCNVSVTSGPGAP